jgi:hypothetical protein
MTSPTSRNLVLLVLGLLSIFFGALSGVPGILIGRNIERSGVGQIGYALCWIFAVFSILAFAVAFAIGVLFR